MRPEIRQFGVDVACAKRPAFMAFKIAMEARIGMPELCQWLNLGHQTILETRLKGGQLRSRSV